MSGSSIAPDPPVASDGLGIVLIAAGQGMRFGARPKCLLELEGEALIRRQITNLLALQPANMVVVLGHYADLIEPAIAEMPLQIVRQTAITFQQADSVRLGLGLMPSQCTHTMICPCDMPALTVDDYRQLLSMYSLRPSSVHFVGPWVNGIPGNPVVFDSHFRHELLTRDTAIGSGKWRHQNRAGVLQWHTNNTHYCLDIDTDADRCAFESQFQQRLRWPDYLEGSE